MSVKADDLGQVAFEAYDEAMLGGDRLPMTWEETHPDVKRSWNAAVNAALEEAKSRCAARQEPEAAEAQGAPSESGDTDGLGQAAYEAYGSAVGWTAYNGERIKDWADQAPVRRRAWVAAAEEVASTVKIGIAAAVMELVPPAQRAEAMADLAGYMSCAECAQSPAGALPIADAQCCKGACEGQGVAG